MAANPVKLPPGFSLESDDAPEVTRLTPEQERMFRAWAQASGITDVDHPDSHYDYRGYFLETKGKPVPQKEGRHFPDTYKQHGHPTFSVESRYSKGPDDGGRWNGEQYVPPTAPQLPQGFVLEDVAPKPSVAEQARLSRERRASGGDIPPTSAYSAEDLQPKGFWGGVKDAVVPSGEGLHRLATATGALNPVPLLPTPKQAAAIADTAANVVRGQAAPAQRAVDSARRGNIGEAVMHAGNAMVPLVGPMADDVGTTAMRGDLSNAAGKLTGYASLAAAPELGGRAVEAATPAYRVTKAASFGDNLRRIAAASPDAPTLMGALKDAGSGAFKAGVMTVLGKAIPGGEMLGKMLGGERAAMAGWKALKDLPKTAAWKAASATAKSQYAKALTTGAIEDAVRIGGEIAAGADATGESVKSPTAPKVVVLEKGGPLVSQSRKYSGSTVEFPADPNAPDENQERMSFAPGRAPSLELPEHFKNARKVGWSMTIGPHLPEQFQAGNTQGLYGASPDVNTTHDFIWQNNPNWRDSSFAWKNVDLLSTPDQLDSRDSMPAPFHNVIMARDSDQPSTATHELNHAVWYRDMTTEQRQAWRDHVDTVASAFANELRATGVMPNDPRFAEVRTQIEKKYPAAIIGYVFNKQVRDLPDAMYAESWAETAGQYMVNPRALKATRPGEYDFVKGVYGGKEYISPIGGKR